MSNHSNYCNVKSEEIIDDCDDDCEVIQDDTYEIKGDELLIELYRERRFLYDKSDPNFKESSMKQNAWVEISQIMTKTSSGNMYTPLQCQKRCISLRDQYCKEKKKAETQSRSGSAAVKRTKFPFMSQLSFLDPLIKRRKSYSNCTKSQQNIIDEDSETNDSQRVTSESNNAIKESKNMLLTNNVEMFNKENDTPKMKKRKVNETKELEQTLTQMSHRIPAYIESNVSTADDAFMEFLKLEFKTVPEKEKNIRRRMIMDALIAPLPEKEHHNTCKYKMILDKILKSELGRRIVYISRE